MAAPRHPVALAVERGGRKVAIIATPTLTTVTRRRDRRASVAFPRAPKHDSGWTWPNPNSAILLTQRLDRGIPDREILINEVSAGRGNLNKCHAKVATNKG